jgi:hypothetical protein
MTKERGKNCDFGLGVVNTTDDPPFVNADVTRIETISNEITVNIETSTVDSSAYGDDFDQFESVTYRWSVDITAYFQTDVPPNVEDIFIDGLLGLGKYKFVVWLAGKDGAAEATAAKPKYSGRVIIENATCTPVRAGLSSLRARLRGDGQLHRAVA